LKPEDFLKNASGKVAVFMHDDGDGACCGALALLVLKKFNVKPELFIAEHGEVSAAELKRWDTIIVLDFTIDHYPELVDAMKGKSVLVVDHHAIKQDLNKLGFIHVNPRFKNPKKYISATEVFYKICVKAGLKGHEWISRLGGVSDNSLDGSEAEVRAAARIAALKSVKVKDSTIKVAKLLAGATSLDEVLYNPIFDKAEETIEKEIGKQIALFEVSTSGPIRFFQIRSKYSIMASTVNRLFDMYPGLTLVVFKQFEDRWKISGRSRKNDLSKAFAEASAGIGVGGGHPTAAGATVSDIEQFKSRLLRILK